MPAVLVETTTNQATKVSIRYKIVLIFLISALIPFVAIGTLVFIDFQNTLRSTTLHNLEAVTSLQETRVVDQLGIYSQGTTNLSQQAPLRQAVQTFLTNPGTKDRLTQALAATQSAGPYGRFVEIEGVAVTDTQGQVLDSTGLVLNKTLPITPDRLLADIFSDQSGAHLLFSTPMIYGERTLARFYIVLSAQSLLSFSANRTGLGQTGEMFLVKQYDDTHGIYVSPLRFDDHAAFNRKIPLSDTYLPSVQALLKKEQTFTNGTVSYRGKPVIGVTRYISQAGLGIVGQIDQAEAFGPINQLTVQVIFFSALLVFFTIFVGSFMSQIFTKPILALVDTATQLSKGDFSTRAQIASNDEVGGLAQAFNLMAGELAEKAKAEAEFIALISHQLRTPTTAVKGFLSLVLEDDNHMSASEKIKMLHLAYSENEKLSRLILQILEVAHFESEKLSINTIPTDLIDLTKGVIDNYQAPLKLRHQTIKFTPPPQPLVANIDGEKMRLAIDNLISNASKYSPPGSQVVIKLGQNTSHYWIKVTDAGFGISKADQPKLFRKFLTINNPKKDTTEGFGLGLYMTKKIVEQHGGNLTLDSSENHGSTFTIELPISG